MTSLTDDAFEEALTDDLGWRRMELVHLKKALADAAAKSTDSPASRGLSRAMVAMCYAHWEGYSKNGLEHYAKLVSRRKPRISEVSDGFVLEHVHRLMKRIASGDREARTSLAAAIRGDSDERIKVDKSLLADTKANLRYSVLAQLFERGCIPLDAFELKANLIDVLLCDRRNGVAHGRALFVPPDQSLELCTEVLGLMESMRDVLIGQVRSKRYLVSRDAAEQKSES
ncbi:MAE_28990/MAE_18760 family HEPN-like nuclease [Nocardioides cavernaquae]|uniref:MAE_28990/MAE_18760 family HEPN-like nuclease n=1 Tax=Nocardioides cavernaquae TaxID=2321396 RepID=UPI001603E16C|nr:MAE_28990/MAE_18760 family HEPN-like nuclease [Nocardioides cavernaquae]